MLYLSTRGHPDRRHFSEILLEGLAPDGGLYLPESYPQITAEQIQAWSAVMTDEMSYADLAFEILSLYIDDIPADDLRALCHKTYTPEVFNSVDITPVTPIGEGLFKLGLSNGPTLAFKDMAMQLLGNLFEYELARRGETLNILGATSGDTGSAAEYAMRGKQGVRVFMLSPHGRMSPFQQAQMFSLQDENIYNIAVEGVFDDCQDIVKAVSHDLEFKRKYRIGTVNSINWARLLAQVVYYFAGYFYTLKATGYTGDFNDLSALPKLDVTVPSGNFGNVCAGHVARSMGLPLGKLVVATNENNVLDEFFRTGVYRVRASADTHETSSPSMDISKASNFERFIFDLVGRDAAKTKSLFTDALKTNAQFDLSGDSCFAKAATEYGFVSGNSTHANRVETIKALNASAGLTIDPHTADGVKVARDVMEADSDGGDGAPMLVLETALPIKFAATIREALGQDPDRPERFNGIEHLPRKVQVLPADMAQVQNIIRTACD